VRAKSRHFDANLETGDAAEKAENARMAGARESERCRVSRVETLKDHFGSELERARNEVHERRIRQEAAMLRKRRCSEDKNAMNANNTQESNGPAKGCNTPFMGTA
jgi:hypothetical protein